jgi:hypothetical protein
VTSARTLYSPIEYLENLLLLSFRDVRVLDGQTPDVKVVANGNDDINDKAAVDTNGETQAREHEGDLVLSVTQGARPAESDMLGKEWAQTVNDAEEQRQDQHVGHGETRLGQMSSDHLTDRVGIDEANIKDKRHKVLAQNDGLKEEVGRNDSPGEEEGSQTVESDDGVLFALPAGSHDVHGAQDSVEDQHGAALNHVPVRPGQIIDDIRDDCEARQAQRGEHGLVPEAATTNVTSECVYETEDDDTLDRTRDNTESQSVGVVFIPGLHVECQERGEENQDGLPALTEAHGC